MEHRFIQKTLEAALDGIPQNANRLTLALRITILLNLMKESYRKLAFRIADSQLCQWFIGVGTPVGEKPPSKSAIQRFEKYWSEEEISALIHDQNEQMSNVENAEKLLNTELPLDFTKFYADSTCA